MYSVLHFIRVPSVFHPWLKTHFLIRSVIDRREHENQIRRGSFEPRMKHGLNTDYEKRRRILDVFRFAFHPCSIGVSSVAKNSFPDPVSDRSKGARKPDS